MTFGEKYRKTTTSSTTSPIAPLKLSEALTTSTKPISFGEKYRKSSAYNIAQQTQQTQIKPLKINILGNNQPLTTSLSTLSMINQPLLPSAEQSFNEIMKNPLNLPKGTASSPTYLEYAKSLTGLEATATFLKTIGDSIGAEKNRIAELFSQKPSTRSEKLGQLFKVITGGVTVGISPISALFAAADKVPVLGTISKLITIPFAVSGDIGRMSTQGAVSLLPISEEAKNNINDAAGEIGALAFQLAIGSVEVIPRIKTELETKFGKEGAKTIIEQAQKKADATPPEVKQQLMLQAPKENLQIQAPTGVGRTVGEGFIMSSEANKANLNYSKALQDYTKKLADYNTKSTPAKLSAVLKAKEVVDAAKAKFDSAKQSMIETNAQKVSFKKTKIQPLKVAEKPVETTPITESPLGKVAKASSDINKGIVEKGFSELPPEELSKYTPITKAGTILKVTDLLTTAKDASFEMAKGLREFPVDMNGADRQVLFNAVKNEAMRTGDIDSLMSLADSPIATARSIAAQTLGASGFNNVVDVVSKMTEIKKTLETQVKDFPRVREKVSKTFKIETIKNTLTKAELSWDNFLKEIQC